MAAFQQGVDREANFAFLYETYFTALQRFFRYKGVSAEDSRDLTQETFVGIYRGLKGYQHSDRFEAWIYRIAETCFLKKLRAAATAKRAAIEVSKDNEDFPEQVLAQPETQLGTIIDQERAQQLRAVLRELPDQMRRCLTLRVYQELSYQEIAVVMSLSVNTVKAHLARAKKRLAEVLGELALDAVLTGELAPGGEPDDRA